MKQKRNLACCFSRAGAAMRFAGRPPVLVPCRRTGAPRISGEICGVDELHAAFLNESRTGGRSLASRKEIRGSCSLFREMWDSTLFPSRSRRIRRLPFRFPRSTSAVFLSGIADFSPRFSPRNRACPHPRNWNGRTLSFRAGRSGERPAYCFPRLPGKTSTPSFASAASMAATLARRIRSRNCAVTARWQRRQRVRMLSRSHSPPPSVTGKM